jgi:hypothetical protein
MYAIFQKKSPPQYFDPFLNPHFLIFNCLTLRLFSIKVKRFFIDEISFTPNFLRP